MRDAGMIGTVVGREIIENRDGTGPALMLQVELSEEEDIQSVEWLNNEGDDYSPPDGAMVYVVPAGSGWKIAVCASDGILPEVNPGEREIYSVDESGEEKAAKLKLTNDGQLIMQDGGDHAVRYAKLEEAFNQLKADHDALVERVNRVILEVYTFAAVYVPGGPADAGTPPTFVFDQATESSSTADIAPAKIENIEVPV